MSKVMFFDWETTSIPKHLPWIPGSYGVTLHTKMEGVRKTWVINHHDVPYHNQWEDINDWFLSADVLCAHNLKFDLHWLRWLGINFYDHQLYCTMVAEYTLSGQTAQGHLSLDALAEKYDLPKKLDVVKQWWDNGFDTPQIPLDILLAYGNRDVDILENIYLLQQPQIEQQNQRKIIDVRCESLKVTEEIEWNGMYIDIEHTRKFSEDYLATIETLTKDLIMFVHDELEIPSYVAVNLASGDDLSAILFGGDIKFDGREKYTKEIWGEEEEEYIVTKKDGTIVPKKRKKKVKVEKEYERNKVYAFTTKGLGFIPAKKSETKKLGVFSTDSAQLSSLVYKDEAQKDFISTLREVNKLKHMNSTYFAGLLKKEIGGYVHPSINETKTGTGRYSCSNPNLQNQPREGTSPVKESFISRFKKEMEDEFHDTQPLRDGHIGLPIFL